MPETVPCLSKLTRLMVNHMCLLPWFTATAGCHMLSNVNSSNQQQLTPGYRQTSKSPNQPRKVKTTTNKIYAWQFKYVLPLCLLFYEFYNYIHCQSFTTCATWWPQITEPEACIQHMIDVQAVYKTSFLKNLTPQILWNNITISIPQNFVYTIDLNTICSTALTHIVSPLVHTLCIHVLTTLLFWYQPCRQHPRVLSSALIDFSTGKKQVIRWYIHCKKTHAHHYI